MSGMIYDTSSILCNATDEQLLVVNLVDEEEIIKVNSFAGTGKTTDLLMVAHTYGRRKILYLVFGKANEREASKKFPKNVKVKTSHAVARGEVKKYAPKVDLSNIKKYRAYDVSRILGISNRIATQVLATFDGFCQSSAEELIGRSGDEHIAHTQKFFEMMDNGEIQASHDFYLKKYQLLLRDGTIRKFGYDIILLDEFQDVNPVTVDIFEHIPAKCKIQVGDIHQQIMSFRGSKNSMVKSKGREVYLTESFRFPPSIAGFANRLLSRWKDEANPILSKVPEPNVDDLILSRAFISRTNGVLIDKIAEVLSFNSTTKCFKTVRNPEDIFCMSLEIHYFLTGNEDLIVTNRFLVNFVSAIALEQYIEESNDIEMETALRIAKQHQDNIIKYKDIALANYTDNEIEDGEILYLTTAHTSKGLEWDYVELGNDFKDFAYILAENDYQSLKEYIKDLRDYRVTTKITDEINLFYVAITRTKKFLNYCACESFQYIDLETDDINRRIQRFYSLIHR